MKNQRKAFRKIEDNRVLRENQADVMQLYQGFGQKSIESIDEIKAAIKENVSRQQLDDNIRNTVMDCTLKSIVPTPLLTRLFT